jgi:hypothetical protein
MMATVQTTRLMSRDLAQPFPAGQLRLGICSILNSVLALLFCFFCSMSRWKARNDDNCVKKTERAANAPSTIVYFWLLLPFRTSVRVSHDSRNRSIIRPIFIGLVIVCSSNSITYRNRFLRSCHLLFSFGIAVFILNNA